MLCSIKIAFFFYRIFFYRIKEFSFIEHMVKNSIFLLKQTWGTKQNKHYSNVFPFS